METRKEIEESNLLFSFDDSYDVIKLDDKAFYRRYFNSMPGAKGVDIVADSDEIIHLVEIKNCLGHEAENRWRISIDNSKLGSAPRGLDVDNRDSFDIEVTKKVAMSILCLFGAWTKVQGTETAKELETYWSGMTTTRIQLDQKQIVVTLFLEGNFDQIAQSRTKRMVMKRIQESIRKKLSWLNCKVLVVDSITYKSKFFMVS